MRLHKREKVIMIIIVAAVLVGMPVRMLASTTSLKKVNTVAGQGNPGFTNGVAKKALFYMPYGLAVDKNGGLIIVDSYNNRIRMLKDNQVTTLAGFVNQTDSNGFPSTGFVDGDTLKARFNHPRGVVVDSKGNIFIADTGNNAIRIITKGKVYTFSGKTEAGYSNGKGKYAQFNMPSGMAIDSEDNLYVADTMNNVIRKISSKGEVTTFAGRYSAVGGYQDGIATTALFLEPSDVAVDKEGCVYVLDSGNQLVRKIKDGMVSTIAGTSSEKIAGTSYAKGGFQNGSAKEAQFQFPMGIDVAEDGSIFIADTWNHRVRWIAPNGVVSTLAGNGMAGLVDGYADTAELNGPVEVLYNKGTLYINDMYNNSIRSMSIDLESMKGILDRSELESAYEFGKATDTMRVWYEGKKLSFASAKPYKKGEEIYIPAKNVFKAWGAKVIWSEKKQQLQVEKKGFSKIFKPGKDMTFLKNKEVYISTESLSELTQLRMEWFPEHNAVVIKTRN